MRFLSISLAFLPLGIMAQGAPPPKPPFKPPNVPHEASWAKIVGSSSGFSKPPAPLILSKEHFLKVKTQVRCKVTIGEDSWSQVRDGMSTSLYAKFLGKSLPLEEAKAALTSAWKDLGRFKVSDLPNGYYYIQCKKEEMHSRLLREGPWTVAGRILQLAP